MKYKVYTNSHMGIGLISIELIITMIILGSFLGDMTNWHPAIRLLVDLAIMVVIVIIFASSKIGCIIISLFYSVVWTLLIGSITNEASNGDKIWIIVIGALVFLISFGLHLSAINDTGYDYEVNSKDDEI